MLLVGCRKPEKDVGLGLLPGDSLGLLVDTVALRAFTFEDTAIRTSGLTRNLLGSYFDTRFGSVKAGIVTQVRLSGNNVGAGQDNSGLVADSLVLALAFDGINYAYGNLGAQVFRTFELNEDLSIDSTYTSDRIPAHLPQDLVANRGGRIKPEPLRKVFIGGDSLAPQLRIRLSNDLASRFLQAFGQPDLANNSAFQRFFKGLYITVDNGAQPPFQQGILYFNLLSTASKLTLYYHDLNNEPELGRSFDFTIDQTCVRYTVVEHDHQSASDPGLPLALSDTASPAPRVYVQTLGGLRTAIRFPGLQPYFGQDAALAKAELVLPLDGTFYPYTPPPLSLFIFRKNDEGKDEFLPDQASAIDGLYRSDERAYRFNITRYIVGVLNRSIPDNGVEIVPSSNGVSANTAVLCGPEHPTTPMQLRLTFTTF